MRSIFDFLIYQDFRVQKFLENLRKNGPLNGVHSSGQAIIETCIWSFILGIICVVGYKTFNHEFKLYLKIIEH